MKVYKTKRRRSRPFATLLSLLMILAGLGVAGYSLGGAGISAAFAEALGGQHVQAPSDTEMKLTVPAMARVKDDPVYNAPAAETSALDQGAVHIEGTGYPWQSGSNVYIAAHRLGYAGTGSFLQFFDLNKLHNGDQIVLTDANGTRYTYTVFRTLIVPPTDYNVTAPVPGKSVVSLQSCTLPDFSSRIIVQGELTSVT